MEMMIIMVSSVLFCCISKWFPLFLKSRVQVKILLFFGMREEVIKRMKHKTNKSRIRLILPLIFMFFFFFGFAPQREYIVEAAETAVSASGEVKTVYSPREVSLLARQYFLDRADEFTIQLVWDKAITEAEFHAIIDATFEGTGVGYEGDYLNEHVKRHTVELSGQIRSGVYYYNFKFNAEYLTTKEEEKEVTSILSGIYRELKLTGKSDVEKVRLIYDYIITHVDYDYDHLNDISYTPQFTARACLVDGKAVCKGISLLLYRMLVDQGIDSRVIAGEAVSNDQVSGSHAWNIVKLEDVYFFLDATWDIGGYHDYYLYGSEDYDDHLMSEEYLTEEFAAKYPISEVNYDTYIAQHPQILTGWQVIDGKKYYYSADGVPVTGLQQIDGKRYFFNSKGVMQTGWLTKSGKTYYLDEQGVLVTGTQKIDGKYYYFNSKGVMHTGWITSGGKTYYFNGDGVRVTGKQVIDGKTYYFSSKGVMTVGWLTSGAKKYYFHEDGTMATGWTKIDGVYYRFKSSGIMMTGWTEYKGNTYYLTETGEMARNCTITIDGTEYTFNKSGVCLNSAA